MMVYKAEYHFEGHYGMDYLDPGDVVELPNGQRFRICWAMKYGPELVYKTDVLGFVYSRELKRIG